MKQSFMRCFLHLDFAFIKLYFYFAVAAVMTGRGRRICTRDLHLILNVSTLQMSETIIHGLILILFQNFIELYFYFSQLSILHFGKMHQ